MEASLVGHTRARYRREPDRVLCAHNGDELLATLRRATHEIITPVVRYIGDLRATFRCSCPTISNSVLGATRFDLAARLTADATAAPSNPLRRNVRSCFAED
jgi:hypothetical protein